MSDFTSGFITGACGALFSFILGVIIGIKWWEWKAIKVIHEIECAQDSEKRTSASATSTP